MARQVITPQQTESAATVPTVDGEKKYPVIKEHGSVVRLPDAAQQPRSGSKICVDVVTKGAPEAINPGLTKLAKYVNIYAGAGQAPASVEIAAVLHGEAVTTVLSDAAYAERFSTEGNPNLPLLRQLKEAGVTTYVCGQSLLSTGASFDQVDSSIVIAVSALTANVNLQQDGYQMIDLRN